MIKVKATQSFAGIISMRMYEERIVEPTAEMQELIDCGFVEVLEDLREDYTGVEVKEMTKRQLVRFAKDNKIPIAEEANLKVILKQVYDVIGKDDDGKTEEEKQNEAK